MKKLYKETLKQLKILLPLIVKLGNITTLVILLTTILLVMLKAETLLQPLGGLTAWITVGGLIYILLIKTIARVDYNHRGDLEIFARANLQHLRSFGFIVFYNALIHGFIETSSYLMDSKNPLSIIIMMSIPLAILTLMYITSFKNMKTKLKGWQVLHSMAWAIIPITMTHVILVKHEISPVFVLFTIVAYLIFIYEILKQKLRKHGVRHLLIYTIGVAVALLILYIS